MSLFFWVSINASINEKENLLTQKKKKQKRKRKKKKEKENPEKDIPICGGIPNVGFEPFYNLWSVWFTRTHCFQNRTGPGGRTVKIGNRDGNRFFKLKELDFLLISWTVKTGVGPLEPVRTVRSNPLSNFFFKKKKKTT